MVAALLQLRNLAHSSWQPPVGEFSVNVKGSLTLLFGCDKIKKQLLKVTLKSSRRRQEVSMRLAAAKEISTDAAVDGDFSEPGDFFVLKEEQRTKLRGFPQWKRCFPLYFQQVLARV